MAVDKETIIKCNKCLSTDFVIRETLFHKATLNEHGILDVTKATGGVEDIVCAECGELHEEDEFEFINF